MKTELFHRPWIIRVLFLVTAVSASVGIALAAQQSAKGRVLRAEDQETGRIYAEAPVQTGEGTAPGTTVEAKALISLTETESFTRTISYHTQGQVVYWYFGQKGALLEESRAFAKAISKVTGYRMDANYEALDPAGYKDWALSAKGIPSLTVEVGSGTNPLPHAQFEQIWKENRNVVYETLLNNCK